MEEEKKKLVLYLLCILTVMVLISPLLLDMFSKNPGRVDITIEDYGKTPIETLGTRAAILQEKRYRKYAYKFYSPSISNFDYKSYLAEHPNDAIYIATDSMRTGEKTLYVFSNHPPDLSYFRVKK